jgi:TetR/AcrR family transcriptional regulator, transcriptional repressor of aconitase
LGILTNSSGSRKRRVQASSAKEKRVIALFDKIDQERGKMPKISEEKRQARRDQILAASWRCFSRRGLHGTSMEDIVREANLSFGAVYLYYESKDELILAACSAAFEGMRALMVPILTREEPYPLPELVRKVTAIITQHAQRDKLNFGIAFLMGWGEAQFNPKIKELVAGGQLLYRQALTAIVQKWQERGDIPAYAKPLEVAKVMLSFFLGFIVQSAMIGGIDPDTAAKGIESLISSKLTSRS